MAYTSRNIKDRVATGDDCFKLIQLTDGRIRLIPSPDMVYEPGTDINKEFLQLLEDRVTWLMNNLYSGITTNPFTVTFGSIEGLTISGVWNSAQGRIEC